MTCNDDFWKGCYTGTFDLITPESFAHPAKMAPNLCYKIIEHLEELGLLKSGDAILDPMSGTGLTAICANAKGYKAVTIELEEKFIGFQKANKDYAGRKLGKALDWTIIQGDSRKLSELLTEHAITVTSPPYHETGNKIPSGSITEWKNKTGEWRTGMRYGDAAGQIGNLKDKPLTVVSPPYEDIQICTTERMGIEASGERTTERKHGETEGNIGNSAESYLSAMRLVYAEIAKVSDVCVVVTKNPTRNGALRRLDLDTVALLKEVGYSILCQHKALLFEESEVQDLFGETHKKVKGRMGFFKRLSYAKGNKVAAWEDVIFAVKNGGGRMVTTFSPPYFSTDVDGARKMPEGYFDRVGGIGHTDTVPYGSTPGQIGKLK